jgi:3-oxoacyl-[acyl-carrier-protein] synthase II
MRRIVITGIGLVTPLGGNTKLTWESLINSKSGISNITKFDSSNITCQVAGEIYESEDDKGAFNSLQYVSAKDSRKMDKFIIYALGATEQAVEDSGWEPKTQEDFEMTGVVVGSGIGGIRTIQESSILIKERGPRKVSPFFIPASLINLASGQISIKYGYQGPNHAVVTACSTGAHAIGDAARIIQAGDANVMIAGGAESALCQAGVAGFAAARALSTGFNDKPTEASRPWDKDRDGFVMGEGAGIVVLEEYEHAKKRGAKIYGELIGYGSTGDGFHMTSPHPDGRGAYRSMSMALKKSGLSTSDIGYINAHGTSTPVGDDIELNVVQKLFENDLSSLKMSSTKSSIGHLLGAAGSVEAIFSLLSLRDSIIPATLNLNNPIENCKIDLVPHSAQEKKLDAVMTNSFGFGGTNATLIFKKI